MRIIKISQEVQNPTPISDTLDVSISKYSDRTWAVYVNGQLLCVTVYLKGARAVSDMLNKLWNRCSDKSDLI